MQGDTGRGLAAAARAVFHSFFAAMFLLELLRGPGQPSIHVDCGGGGMCERVSECVCVCMYCTHRWHATNGYLDLVYATQRRQVLLGAD